MGQRTTKDHENNKFFLDPNGDSVVRTGNQEGMLAGVKYDTIEATYPDTITEIFTYKLNGSSVAVIIITYTDNTKENISTAVKV